MVNVEGSGSQGPSLLLRSGPGSGAMLDAFRETARFGRIVLLGGIVQTAAQRHRSNGLIHAGSLIDFAFGLGERNHSPLPRGDSIANLSLATPQHHGENALPLVRALSAVDLTIDAPNYVYSTLNQPFWFAYRPETGLAIAICIVALLGLATWRRWQGPGHFFAALGIVSLALVTTVVLELATLALADVLAGTRVSWPANPWPWRLIVYSVPVIALALQRPLVRRVGFWNSLLAAWWFWTLLTLALAAYLPLASHLTLPATVAATLVIVVLAFAHRLDRPGIPFVRRQLSTRRSPACSCCRSPIGREQGFNAAPVMFVPLALVAVTLLPLLDRDASVAGDRRRGALLVGIAWAHGVAHSELRPQRINYTYVLSDADANRATYLCMESEPLPHRSPRRRVAGAEQTRCPGTASRRFWPADRSAASDHASPASVS